MHDISQPLVALINNSEVLLRYARAVPSLAQLLRAYGQVLPQHERKRARELVEELPELARDIFDAAQVATAILRNMKALGSGSRFEDDPVADPIAVIGHALSIAKAEMPPRTRARYVGRNALPPVRIAPTDLFRVLVNLLVNGAQAIRRKGDGGGEIELDTVVADAEVTFVVRDDGPGMSQAVLKNATKEFFSTRSDGTGLGLSQCRRLVEVTGGRFAIDSAEGDGTTVTLSLPRADVAKEPTARRDVS
jgi:signal transduction histidine kinase